MEDVEGENDADSYASEESSHFPGDLKYQIPDKLTNFILSLKESQATQIASSLDSAAIEIPEEHNAQTGDEAAAPSPYQALDDDDQSTALTLTL
eukprot:CAMPEP_0185596376 /NCGR_PEP_ID=MMETSP0434-20130131/80721_1 /TAXON_ID=626734 ORGANISM="Favella taraikaensis, Strain Fe Narragansett Bay" /NCGR_SAMPLE_ID=MMETSP0434 /ASSEMBLY_ACC=CAM_ASM_000379 /LENGTH=93 /DNA_ID=CAMNT_0028224867 /DNA_START=2070 /DNA_END=2347 /DNA_ORIENTATION=-